MSRNRRRKLIRKQEAVTPGVATKPLVPDLEGFSKEFKIEEAGPWADARLPVFMEEMTTGERVFFHRDDTEIFAFDKNGKDVTDQFNEIANLLSKIKSGEFIFDGYVGEDGIYRISDALYIDKDITKEPFTERRMALDTYAAGNLDPAGIVQVVTATQIDSEESLELESKQLFSKEGVSGIVLKAASSPYELNGSTTNWYAALKPKDEEPDLVTKMLDDTQIAALKIMGYEIVEKEDKPSESKNIRVIKQDDEKQLIYGEVLVPNKIDGHGDIMSIEDIEFAAHHYLAVKGIIGLKHKEAIDAVAVESYIAPVDFEMGGAIVKQGTWVLVVFVEDPKMWQDVKDGELNAFSPGGFGDKEQLL